MICLSINPGFEPAIEALNDLSVRLSFLGENGRSSFPSSRINALPKIFFFCRRLKSYEESNKYQESFDVYVQALISQCLDPEFLVEVIRDQGKYFEIRLAPQVPYGIVLLFPLPP